jgi:hypothetical protein
MCGGIAPPRKSHWFRNLICPPGIVPTGRPSGRGLPKMPTPDNKPLPILSAEFSSFYDKNPQFDLSTFNFFDVEAVRRLNWPEGLKAGAALPVLMAQQRVVRIHPNTYVGDALLVSGFDSAHSIASLPEDRFVEIMAGAFQGDSQAARAIHRKAATIKGQTIHLWANIHSAVASSHSRGSNADNVSDEVVQFFSTLPTYEELFGTLDYCECEHCQSIFGPAAYFVDLMRITDRYVTEPNKKTIPPALTLESRRQFLFKMPLTCAATNDLVPYIQIVNEVLAGRAAHELNTADVYHTLALADYPFNLPDNVLLDEIRLYMGLLGASLAEIYTVFSPAPDGQTAPPLATAREILGLSIEQYQLVITPTPNESKLKEFYGLSAQQSLSNLNNEPVFLLQTRLTHERLEALLSQNLSRAELDAKLAHGFFFNIPLPADEYVYIHVPEAGDRQLKNLTLETLDRLNRFIRFAQWTGVAFADLDWTLNSIAATEFTSAVIRDLSLISEAGAMYGLAPDVMAAFWADMKTIGVGHGRYSEALFDRVYNHPSLLTAGHPYHPLYQKNPLYKDEVVIWDVDSNERVSDQFGRPRLMAALGLSDTALTEIAEALYGEGQQVPLDVPHLSQLYRLSLILSSLKLSLDDYLTLLSILDLSLENAFKPAHLVELRLTTRWLDSNNLSVSDLKYILTGEPQYAPTPAPSSPVAYDFMRAVWVLMQPGLLQPGSFNADLIPPARSEDAFRALLMSPQELIASVRINYEKVFGKLPDTDIALVVKPVTVAELDFLKGHDFTEKQIEIIAEVLLTTYDAQVSLLNTQLSSLLETSVEVLAALGYYVSKVFPVAPVVQLMLTPVRECSEGSRADSGGCEQYSEAWLLIMNVMQQLSWATFAAKRLNLSGALLVNMAENPAAYEITSPLEPSLDAVRSVLNLKALTEAFGDTQAEFLSYLSMPHDEDCDYGEKSAALSVLTGWPQLQICKLTEYLGQGTSIYDTVNGVARLNLCFDVLERTGLDAFFVDNLLRLQDLAAAPPADWQLYKDTARSLVAAANAKHESNWEELNGKVVSQLNERKRDVLEWFVLWKLRQHDSTFTSTRQLYELLLIDVEMSGCANTSYIAEGMNAVQLYLQRCRLNLEPGVEKLLVPEVWWEWLLNYRVWEANRKIFLYPENYLIPSLRKSKTSLFKSLEEALMQSDVSRSSVESAFRSYLDGFASLTTLSYIDAYQCLVDDNRQEPVETLFLFTRTKAEPYNYYFNSKAVNSYWGEWQKIDVPITAQYITPIYAFSRLLVFWVELKQVSTFQIDTKDQKTVSANQAIFAAAVRYSFYDFNGNWVAPQTLYEEQIAYVAPSHPPFTEDSGYQLFDVRNLYWHKVNAVRVAPENMEIPPENTSASEKIVILYGPFLENNTAGIPFTTIPPPPGPVEAIENPSKYVFDLNNYNRMLDNNQAVREPVRGPLPLIDARVINNDLNLDFLMRNTEFLLLEENRSPGVPPAFTPRLDVALSSLNVAPTLNVLQENYYGDYTSNISSTRRPTPTTKQSFISEGINDIGSQQVFNDLLANHVLVSGTNKVTPQFSLNTDLSFLFSGEDPEVKASLTATVQEILLDLRAGDLPAQTDSFFLEDIDAVGSEQVFIDLKVNNIIDAVGYVKGFFTSSTDLSFLFGGAPAEQKQLLISEIRRLLFAYMGDPTLLMAVARSNAKTIMVKNQPDAFVFNNGDESFLVETNAAPLPTISSHMKVSVVPSRPKVFPDSFITQDIDAVGSEQVYHDLQIANLVGNTPLDEGLVSPFLTPRTNLSFLFGGEPQPKRARLIAEVREILLSLSTITSLKYYFEDDNLLIGSVSFVASGIDAAASAAVYDALVGQGIVGSDGVISPSFGKSTDLAFLFPNVSDPERKEILVGEVQRILSSYFDATWMRSVHDLQFRFTRLTTGAIPRLSRSLFAGGISSLLSLESQQIPVVPVLPFTRYGPNEWKVIPPAQFDGTQVDFDGPYGLYYWELFFYAPQLIAARQMADRRFNEAQSWYQYIFNPTVREQPLAPDSFMTPDISRSLSEQAYAQLKEKGIITPDDQVSTDFDEDTSLAFLWPEISADDPRKERMIREVRSVLLNFQLSKPSARFWQFQPFRNHTLQSLQKILTDAAQIAVYNNNPFDPYAVARLRIGSFEKAIYMGYLDNLIAWGDAMFAQYTWEGLTSATMLYVYAYNLLGEKPANVGACPSKPPTTFECIRKKYQGTSGGIPQFLIDMENFISASTHAAPEIYGKPFNEVDAYFCVPENPQMLAYWDLVEDRLYKVRNCLDLEGKPLTLPLFPPPINPLDLVRAAAAGRSSLSVVEQQRPSIPAYRFTSSLMHARMLTSTVSQLGSSLFSALVGRDVEALARLRANQELAILNLTTYLKTKQVEAAQFTLAGLQESARAIKARGTYYTDLADNKLSPAEISNLTFSSLAIVLKAISTGLTTASAIAYATPQIGAPTSLNYGGYQMGNSLAKWAAVTDIGAQVSDFAAQTSLTVAGYQRREQDWRFQAEQAGLESTQMQKQIDAAQVQLQMTQRELEIQLLSVKQAEEMQKFLTTKFDSKELYIWIAGRVSALYFQAYKLALDAALAAQSAYRFELDRADDFINFNYWDSLHQGLYAGEGLDSALNQMERAFMRNNTRRLEVKKPVSLATISPAELLRLKTTGECYIDLTQALYDFDFPGQYCRQIKSVELRLVTENDEAVEIHATLTQTQNDIVLQPSLKAVEFLLSDKGGSDVPPEIRRNWQSQQQITFFSNDYPSGTLENVIFYTDERYLPFEGTGAVSKWVYSMPPQTNHFNFESINDLVITVGYTALYGGEKFKHDVEGLLSGARFSGATYLSLKGAYPEAWARFMSHHGDHSKQVLTFDISTSNLPPHFKGFQLHTVNLQLRTASVEMPATSHFINLKHGSGEMRPVVLTDGYSTMKLESPEAQQRFKGTWRLEVMLDKLKANRRLKGLLGADGFLEPEALTDIELILEYRACAFNCA